MPLPSISSNSIASDAVLPLLGSRVEEGLHWTPGSVFHHLPECPSTNTVLKEMADTSPIGTVVVTDDQTGGRGRLGRTWLSEAGQDLAFSVLLRPRLAPEQAHLLALATGVAVARKGNPIGLNVMLSHTQLVPDQTIEGAITIKNLGDKTGVQFKIEIDGFDPESYDVGPAPILFPDVEKKVPFRLRHPQRATPPAGNRRLTIRVTAPAAYPGEVATASQVIRVTPYLKHSLSLKISG